MSDSSDDMEMFSGFCDDDDYDDHKDFEVKRKAVVEYCYSHLEQMWAAKITGILLGCDFREAKEHADIYLDEV